MKKIFTRKKTVILLVVLAAGFAAFNLMNKSKTEEVFAANVAPLEKKTIE